MNYVKFLVEDRGAGQAYLRSHINTCIYTLDFLKHAKARGTEVDEVEETIAAMGRLHTQVGREPCTVYRVPTHWSSRICHSTDVVHSSCKYPNMQIKWVAAPPKPKDVTAMAARGWWVDYQELAKGTYTIVE